MFGTRPATALVIGNDDNELDPGGPLAIYLDQLGRTVTGDPFTWGPDDASLYALSVGASGDGRSELDYTTADAAENPSVLPGFAVILTLRSASSPLKHVGDFPLSRIIHAGQTVELDTPLPSSGAAIGTSEVTGIFDAGKHAIIETTTSLRDAESATELARTRSTVLVLGEGGFGGDRPPSRPTDPIGEATGRSSFRTSPQQALLYRLNGDRNPLHFDVTAATAVGFSRPILHGLCTFGIVSRQLLNELCGGHADRFQEFSARFVKPVYPGATLKTDWWQDGGRVNFRTEADGETVLDSGLFVFQT